MPYQFHFFPTDFKGNLETGRCRGHNKSGAQCSRKVAIGYEYCFQHLRSQKHLNIKTSNIPNAGKGLFAYDKSEPANAVIFRPNQVITDYNGQNISKDTVEERYGNGTAPYTVQLKNNVYTDAALKRGVASLANRPPPRTQSNAYFRANTSIQPQRVQLKADKIIRNYQEILPTYGQGRYQLQNNYRTKYVK